MAERQMSVDSYIKLSSILYMPGLSLKLPDWSQDEVQCLWDVAWMCDNGTMVTSWHQITVIATSIFVLSRPDADLYSHILQALHFYYISCSM